MAGPFYFAWVDSTETTFNESHHVEHEQVLAFTLSHKEGDFPLLEITIINPKVGLLASGRKVWAWLSYDRNWQPPAPDQEESEEESWSEDMSEPTPDIVPLFFGRLVAIPEDLQAEQITLAFIARPQDYAAQKAELAATLRVRPYWDAIWFSPETRNDPDNVLESRPELWHIDRITHEVTTSNIITGEDGVIALGEDDVIYDSLRVTFGEAPLRRVEVIASVSWNQNAVLDGMDISHLLNHGAPHSILTFTGDGLVAKWPKSGTRIGGGWEVTHGEAVRVDGIGQAVWGYGLRNTAGASAGVSANPFGRSYIATEEFHDVIVPEWAEAQTIANVPFPARILGIPRWRIIPTLRVGFNVSRKRSEQLAFTLEADVQATVTEPGDEEVLQLSFSSSEIASPVDPPDESSESASEGELLLPIRDVRSPVYFSTPRGTQSVEYLLALARSKLLARARCVSVQCEISFTLGVALELSCRKSVVLTDYRLPGGQAAGKITEYSLSADGESGALTCSITFACTVGKGDAVTAVEGEPTYVEEGYVDVGYQFYAGAYVMPIPGEVAYGTIEGLPAQDDGVNFFNITPEHFVLNVEKTGTWEEQKIAMGERANEPNEVFQRLNAVPTRFALTMRPVEGGPFETLFNVPTSLLMVPKTIDLEAAS